MGKREGAVRVCIVYEHSLFAHGLRGLLERDKTLQMVGMIERPLVSLPQLRRLKPDVVVVEGNGELSILESIEEMTEVGVNLRNQEATIVTRRSIKASRPEELIATIRTLLKKRTGKESGGPRTHGRDGGM